MVWLYTPLALEAARVLKPTVLVYDVMDDLASFKDASPALVTAHDQAVAEADVVFAGGRSLHAGFVARGRADAYLFPNGWIPSTTNRGADEHAAVRIAWPGTSASSTSDSTSS